MRFLSNRLKIRLVISTIVLWFGGAIMCLALNAGEFFTIASGQVQSYNTITTEEMRNGLPIEGDLYLVFGIVADGYTENVDKYGTKTVSNKVYYYAVPFEDDSVMLVLTNQESTADQQIYRLYEASCGDGSDPLLDTGVPISGILRPTDSEVEQYAKEAFAEIGVKNMKVEPYTIDCKRSVKSFVYGFWIGVILLVTFAAASIFIVKKIIDTNRANKMAIARSAAPIGTSTSYAPNSSFASAGTSDRYDPERPFSSYDRTELPQFNTQSTTEGSTFRSQQGSGTSSQTYRPQNSGYGSTFQTQQGSGSSSQTYRPQSSSYGSTFQSQQGNSSSSQTYRPQNSGYGSTFQSQQGSGSSSQTYQPKYQNNYKPQENDPFQ